MFDGIYKGILFVDFLVVRAPSQKIQRNTVEISQRQQMLQGDGLVAPFITAVDCLLYLQYRCHLGLRQVGILAHVPDPLKIHVIAPLHKHEKILLTVWHGTC